MDEKLFAALASAVGHRMGELIAQSLANTVWAFATGAHLEEKVFQALARAAGQRAGEFNRQGLANTAWAFATAK